VTSLKSHPLHRPDLYEAFRRGDAVLARAMAERQKLIMAKERLAAAGQPDDAVYRLHSGWLCRSRYISAGRRQILLVYLPGDLVGVKSLLYARQPDTIECLTDATVHWVEQTQLRALVTSQSDVALRVMWQIAEQERQLHNWVTGLGQCEANERLAAVLTGFYLRLKRLNLVNGNRYRLPMTQRDIGDYLGLTPVHVGRVLNRFRKRGLATVENWVATLHSITALAQMAAPMWDWCERPAIEAELHRPGLTDADAGVTIGALGTSSTLGDRQPADPAADLCQSKERSLAGDKPKRHDISQLGRSLSAHGTAVTGDSQPSPQESEDELDSGSSGK
jgi:CRP/FNR family transcriptional regulator, anaerobic regulatory protein